MLSHGLALGRASGSVHLPIPTGSRPSGPIVAKGGKAAYYVVREAPEPGGGLLAEMTAEESYFRIDLATGAVTNLSETMQEFLDGYEGGGWEVLGRIRPSPDGCQVLFNAETYDLKTDKLKSRWLLYGLADKKVVRLAPADIDDAGWFGERLGYLRKAKGSELMPICLLDPATMRSTELRLRGKLVGWDRRGETLVAIANPKRPAGGSDRELLASGKVVSADATGKVLATLCDAKSFAQVAVSPGGKYVALRQVEGLRGPIRRQWVTILTVAGQAKRKMAGAIMPSAVSDDGALAGIVRKIDPNATRWAALRAAPGQLTTWSADGKKKILCEKAWGACEQDGKLYYIEAGEPPALKWVTWPSESTK